MAAGSTAAGPCLCALMRLRRRVQRQRWRMHARRQGLTSDLAAEREPGQLDTRSVGRDDDCLQKPTTLSASLGGACQEQHRGDHHRGGCGGHGSGSLVPSKNCKEERVNSRVRRSVRLSASVEWECRMRVPHGVCRVVTPHAEWTLSVRVGRLAVGALT
jgi:hypothetical protein